MKGQIENEIWIILINYDGFLSIIEYRNEITKWSKDSNINTL